MSDTPWYVSVGVAVIGGLFGVAGNQLLERFRARNALQHAELDARRTYEYEARTRLYTEAEPLLFQLYEQADLAADRIADLALRGKRGQLGKGGWLSDEWAYYRPSTIYMLLAPGATFLQLRDRVTFLDLSLDSALDLQYRLARAAYDSWSSDFALAKHATKIAYNPNDTQEWQGLLPGKRERPMLGLLVKTDGHTRVQTYTEFEDLFERKTPRTLKSKSFDDFSELFDERFTQVARPILWRVLVSQYFCYLALRNVRDQYQDARATGGLPRPDANGILRAVSTVDERDLNFGAEGAADAIAIGKRYLTHTLFSKESFQKCSESQCAACSMNGRPASDM
jgi:hypothetical protein